MFRRIRATIVAVEIQRALYILSVCLRWKPMSKRPIRRPKTRWEDGVLEDIKNINVRNWKKVAENRDSWKKTIEQVRILDRL
jgi:hypothetical protein